MNECAITVAAADLAGELLTVVRCVSSRPARKIVLREELNCCLEFAGRNLSQWPDDRPT
jgi:hypothetical protein